MIGLCRLTSASIVASVTVQPWRSRSPVSSSTNTAGQWSLSVSGSIAMKIRPYRLLASSCADLRDGSSSLSLWPTRVKGRITEPCRRGSPSLAQRCPSIQAHYASLRHTACGTARWDLYRDVRAYSPDLRKDTKFCEPTYQIGHPRPVGCRARPDHQGVTGEGTFSPVAAAARTVRS